MCVFRPVLQRFGSDIAHVLHVKAGSAAVIIGFAVSQCRRTHGPCVASVPGSINRTAVIMSPSNVLLNTLASIPYIFNRCESRQRTRHVYWKPLGGCRKNSARMSALKLSKEKSVGCL